MTINNPGDYELDHNVVKNTLHLFNPDYFCLVDCGKKQKPALTKTGLKWQGQKDLKRNRSTFEYFYIITFLLKCP